MTVPALPAHVLITGASSGIGEALALDYARPGLTLSLSGRDSTRLNAVAQACRARGATVDTAILDVTDRDATAAWVNCRDDAQPLDLVIANAGISGGTSGLHDEEPRVRQIFAVNLDGVLNTVFPALPRMRARKRGHIALMSSLAGFRGVGNPAYSASKAAVRVWGEGLRNVVAPDGIAVSVICPGWVESRITDLNTFPMPFFMNGARGARVIRRGLDARRTRIAFPWPTFAAAWLLAVLPDSLAAKLTRNTAGKEP